MHLKEVEILFLLFQIVIFWKQPDVVGFHLVVVLEAIELSEFGHIFDPILFMFEVSYLGTEFLTLDPEKF